MRGLFPRFAALQHKGSRLPPPSLEKDKAGKEKAVHVAPALRMDRSYSPCRLIRTAQR
jgi:hypothetical protein